MDMCPGFYHSRENNSPISLKTLLRSIVEPNTKDEDHNNIFTLGVPVMYTDQQFADTYPSLPRNIYLFNLF